MTSPADELRAASSLVEFRTAVKRWHQSPNPHDAARVVKGAPGVLDLLDAARAREKESSTDLAEARGSARTYRNNFEVLDRRAAAARTVADSLHEPGFTESGCRPCCPGCQVLAAINGQQDGDPRG